MTCGPHSLAALRLSDLSQPLHGDARQFCLGVINEVYGIGYRPDWHFDLDSLLESKGANHYSTGNRGCFWVVRDRTAILATAGLCRLSFKPDCAALFEDLYGDGSETAFLGRTYLRKDCRGVGYGTWLSALCEAEARRYGYGRIYLHAASQSERTVNFWKKMGYRVLSDDGETIHFDKTLH